MPIRVQITTTTCDSALRATKSERDHETDRKRTASVRIGAADERNVGCEHIDVRERVAQAAARMPVIVSQDTVVLKQQFRCVDLTREY